MCCRCLPCKVLVGGVKMRWPCKAKQQFMELAEACECLRGAAV